MNTNNIQVLPNGQGIAIRSEKTLVRNVGSIVLINPSTGAPYIQPTNVTSTFYSKALLVKNAPGTLYSVTGFNSGSAQFIQLHDLATVPVANAVPVVFIYVAANSNFSYYVTRSFTKGIAIVSSSTGPIYTIPNNSDCWFDCQVV